MQIQENRNTKMHTHITNYEDDLISLWPHDILIFKLLISILSYKSLSVLNVCICVLFNNNNNSRVINLIC